MVFNWEKCHTCREFLKSCIPQHDTDTSNCKSYKRFPYYGENTEGKKCMKCSSCGQIMENALWYAFKNIHYCPTCKDYKTMVNLDNEKDFNPSRRYNPEET